MDIATLVDIKRNPKIPELAPGDTVKVHVKVIEGERERIQVFQGVVIRVKQGSTGSFTVRRVAYGIGAERTFPVNSPLVDKVEVMRHGKVRRARLFYLRGLTAKKARLKEKRGELKPEVGMVDETAPAPEPTVSESAPTVVTNEVPAAQATAPAKLAPGPEVAKAAPTATPENKV